MSEQGRTASGEAHELILNSRERLTINGIKEIINFDENSVNLKTQCGELSVEGEGIHIDILNVEKGEALLRGKINGLNYFDGESGERRSLLSKIFGER